MAASGLSTKSYREEARFNVARFAAYIAFEASHALVSREEPETSAVGLILSVVSLAVRPTLPAICTRIVCLAEPASSNSRSSGERVTNTSSLRATRYAAVSGTAALSTSRRGERTSPATWSPEPAT